MNKKMKKKKNRVYWAESQGTVVGNECRTQPAVNMCVRFDADKL